MHQEIEGFKITEQIREDRTTQIYRGHRIHDDRRVILKILKPDAVSPDRITRFKQEFDILLHLDQTGVIKALDLKQYLNSYLLILEDSAGKSVEYLIRDRMNDLKEFLDIAIRMTRIIRDLHASNIIHKDIRPAHFFQNPDTRELTLIDLSCVTTLSSEKPVLQDTELFADTLIYISPEQTGRMNRMLDYRSDLYSLGVIFYEMFTGRVPFESRDVMDLVYSHIAKRPLPPDTVHTDIPHVLSDIVMKLLEKDAENRYQSAGGLQADLERCLRQLDDTNRIEPFPLALNDVAGAFHISQKLYGRENEVEILLQTFDRVTTGGTKLLLVTGYSGVGKTALVHEVHKPITARRGYFIEGKFDQLQQNIPYFGLIHAFTVLVRSLLMENELQLAEWKQNILEAIGNNGRVLTDVIPDLELIIGLQPPVQELNSTGAQFRFNNVFEAFITAIVSSKHPLVVFLDDLQWIDPASLTLLEYIITSPDTKYLLLIGAFRDNEVYPSHPLILGLDTIRKKGIESQTLVLSPLSLEDVSHLAVDTFHTDHERVEPLARLIFEKTVGNPFFVNQFLITLSDEKLVEFDRIGSLWIWNIARIRSKGYTDNVTDLMVEKLRKLSEQKLQVLMLASCIGNQFNLHTLAVISSIPDDETRIILEDALREGLVLAETGTTYRFFHDRVQQAAYSLIPETEQDELHLRIGRLLLADLSELTRDEQVFTIVSHLNRGADLLVDQQEKYQIAGLNLHAGKKAQASTAYVSAVNFYTAGIALLDTESWNIQHDLTYSLYAGLAECTFLKGAPIEARQICDSILINADTNVERVRMYLLKIDLLTTIGEIIPALTSGIECLHMLGVDIPINPTDEQTRAEDELLQNLMGDQQIEDLLYLPDNVDPEISAALEILTIMHPPSHFIPDPNLYLLIPPLMINISLRHGNAPASAFAYGDYAILLTNKERDYDAYRFGKVACDLVERFNSMKYRSKVYFMMGGVIAQFFKPIAVAQDYLNRCFQAAVEVGDIPFACFARIDTLLFTFIKGEPLNVVYLESERCLDFSRKVRFEMIATLAVCEQRLIQALSGHTIHIGTFDDATFSETTFEEQVKGNIHDFCWYHICKLQLQFFAGDYASALLSVNELKDRLFLILGEPISIEYYYYAALTIVACYPQAPVEEKQTLDQTLREYIKKLKIWAEYCPETFQNRYALVSAEVARIEERDTDAIHLYEEAIQSSREYGFIQNEALASELVARFWRHKGHKEFARSFMTYAYRGYQRWQAFGKTKALEAQYPGWFVEEGEQHLTEETGALDLNTMLKATHMISGEIELDRLFLTMMDIVIENAGAQRGVLVLEKDGTWVIAAEKEIDVPTVTNRLSVNIDETERISAGIIRYVARTREPVVLDNAAGQGMFVSDPFVRQHQTKSLLCTPLLNRGNLIGVLYLENNLATHVFTRERIHLLEIIAAQAAISLENARMYEELLRKNEELHAVNEELMAADEELRANYIELSSRDQELQESERKFRAIFDQTFQFIGLMTPEGTILESNQTALNFSGIIESDIIGKPIWETPWWTHSRELQVKLRSAVEDAAKGKFVRFEATHSAADGSLRYVDFSIKPVMDEAGHVVLLIPEGRDINEQKMAQNSLERATKKLSLLNSITFSDIQNAIFSLSGYLELEKIDKPDEKIDRYLEREIGIVKTISDSLKFANYYQNLGLKTPAWQSVIQSFLFGISHLDISNLSRQLNIEGLEIYADPLLENVFFTLTENVVLHGKTATEISLSYHESPEGLTLVFEDNGRGIADNMKDKIFDRQYEEKKGIGLFLSREILSITNITIKETGEPGEGARFEIFVPKGMFRFPDPG